LRLGGTVGQVRKEPLLRCSAGNIQPAADPDIEAYNGHRDATISSEPGAPGSPSPTDLFSEVSEPTP
jgi:hypothetical protein